MSKAEWEFFGRIENLEQEIEIMHPTLKDAITLAILTYGIAFFAVALHSPEHVRRIKDSYMKELKTFGVSPGLLEMLERIMLGVCDIVEESSKASG